MCLSTCFYDVGCREDVSVDRLDAATKLINNSLSVLYRNTRVSSIYIYIYIYICIVQLYNINIMSGKTAANTKPPLSVCFCTPPSSACFCTPPSSALLLHDAIDAAVVCLLLHAAIVCTASPLRNRLHGFSTSQSSARLLHFAIVCTILLGLEGLGCPA